MDTLGQRISLSRRGLLATGAGLGAGLLLSSCAPGGQPGSSGGPSASGGTVTLELQTHANDKERVAFENLIADYQAKKPGVTINLNVVPAESMQEKFQARLAAGNPPDLARIPYQNMGRYTSSGVLVDLSSHLPQGFSDEFSPAFWTAIAHEGKPFGVPHHTGAFVIYYNKAMFAEAGITELPASADAGWRWDEFEEICAKLKAAGTAKYPFAPPWTGAGSAYRWMWFLYMRGGTLLNEALTEPAIESPAGIDAIDFTKRWFDNGLVPPNSSIKSAEAPQQLFSTGIIAMMMGGPSQLSYLRQHMTEEWGVTYLMRDVSTASDLGGNALVLTKDSKNHDVAADFLKFSVEAGPMAKFVTEMGFIPTRKDLAAQTLDYKEDADLMPTFLEQSLHVPPQLAAEQTIAEFNSLNTLLGDELESAFKMGQSAADTARNIAAGIKDIL